MARQKQQKEKRGSQKKKKAKSDKKKHHRRRKHSSQSFSRSRSYSERVSNRSRPYSSSPQSQRVGVHQKKSQERDKQQPRLSSKPPLVKNRVNSNLLVGIISNQKKMNCKLDTQETNRAASKFKQKFKQEIKAVTMSSFLSNQQLVRKIEARSIGATLFCQPCNRYFESKDELTEHLERHREGQ